jgi:PAS domain S-box-containing protein
MTQPPTAWLSAAFDATGHAMCLVDENGKVLHCNPAMAELLGQPAPALSGQALQDLAEAALAPLDLPSLLLNPGTGQRVVAELPIGVRWFQATADPVRDDRSTVVGALLVLIDITERKQAEAEILRLLSREESARRAAEAAQEREAILAEASALLAASLDYETTLERVAPLVVPHLADWCIVDVVESDGSVRRLTVAHADPAKQAVVRELMRFPPDPDGSQPVPTVLRTRRSVLYSDITEETLMEVNRGPEHLEIMRALAPRSARGVPIAARGRILGVITFMAAESGRRYGPAEVKLAEDLAHRVALAIDNARLYRDAQERERLKDEFLAMLAHELRNPLGAISNAVHLLRMGSLQERVVARQHEVLVRQVGQLTHLLNDLLDVSRLTRGKIQLRLQPVDLAAAVHQAVDLNRDQIEARRHALTVSLPAALVRLEADPVRLVQILDNLLNNAAKYTEPGGQIALIVTAEEQQLDIRVRDTGSGIPPELLPRVFDMFAQGDRALDRAQGGLGIGLTIVRRLVELHGGQIIAYSEGPGRGSEFHFCLPLTRGANPQEAKRGAHPATGPQRSSGQNGDPMADDEPSDSEETLCTPHS